MPRIGRDEVAEATRIYNESRAGRKKLDDRIVENARWYRLQHWQGLRADRKRRQTGWLTAAIINKHADFMDNRPEVTVIPREKSDEETAKTLTEILPVVLKRAGWDETYSRSCDDKLQFGGGIVGVLWDPAADEGLGEIRTMRIDPLNIVWDPGIEHIQDSRNVFVTSIVPHAALIEQYPKIRDLSKRLNAPATAAARYMTNESIDMSDKSEVIDWYYKRNGVLHYCRYVQDIVLFATENEDGYGDGWYADGRYPFVIDPYMRDPYSPYGFGMIDLGRDTQEDIDQLSDLTMANAKIAARRRYFMREDANVNEAEFLDLDQDIVHFSGTVDKYAIREIPAQSYGGIYVQILQSKVDELKENIHSRDVNTGGGTTQTAAGIAALQESGSKASRDAIQQTYRAFEQVVDMVIERIRQFYTVPRIFRIVGPDKRVSYVDFDNRMIAGRPIGDGITMPFGDKKPVFDLDVRVGKSNVWSRQAQNQDVISFYNMGFFMPQNSTQALACLQVLDIDNKDKLIETIRDNGMREQFLRQFLPVLLQAAAMADPNLGAAAMQAAQAAGLIQTQEQPIQQGPQPDGDRGTAGQMDRSRAYMDRQRELTRARTEPV